MKTTARSMAYMKKLGFSSIWLVERRAGPVAVDLWNFIDLLCLDGKPGVLGIQSCGTDLQPHIEKIKNNEYVKPYLDAGNRLQIQAWRKTKLFKGSVAIRWQPRIINVNLVSNELEFMDLHN